MGKPILVGPYMFNFKDIYALLSGRGACIMTGGEEEFGETLMGLLANPDKMKTMGEKALEVVRENQGATKRNVDALEKMADEVHIKLGGNPS